MTPASLLTRALTNGICDVMEPRPVYLCYVEEGPGDCLHIEMGPTYAVPPGAGEQLYIDDKNWRVTRIVWSVYTLDDALRLQPHYDESLLRRIYPQQCVTVYIKRVLKRAPKRGR